MGPLDALLDENGVVEAELLQGQILFPETVAGLGEQEAVVLLSLVLVSVFLDVDGCGEMDKESISESGERFRIVLQMRTVVQNFSC